MYFHTNFVEWDIRGFIFPRKLIDGTWSRWGELLAYRTQHGVTVFRRATPDEADAYNSQRQAW